jgi:hypothetical protein
MYIGLLANLATLPVGIGTDGGWDMGVYGNYGGLGHSGKGTSRKKSEQRYKWGRRGREAFLG